jgi:hypothetical protein
MRVKVRRTSIERKNMIPCPCCGTDAPAFLRNEEIKKLCDQLEQKLLAVGGKAVVYPDDESELARLVAKGKLAPHKVRLVKGRLNEPLDNVLRYWGQDVENTRVMWGYALCDDDLWRQHVWMVKSKRVLEATLKRRKYFGVALDQYDVLDVWMHQVLATRYPERDGKAFDDAFRRYPGPMRLVHETMKKDYDEHREAMEQHMKEGKPYRGRYYQIVPSAESTGHSGPTFSVN